MGPSSVVFLSTLLIAVRAFAPTNNCHLGARGLPLRGKCHLSTNFRSRHLAYSLSTSVKAALMDVTMPALSSTMKEGLPTVHLETLLCSLFNVDSSFGSYEQG